MGQDASKLSHLRKCIKTNDRELTAVKVEGMQVSDKSIRKLSEALRKNRYTVSQSVSVATGCYNMLQQLVLLHQLHGQSLGNN